MSDTGNPDLVVRGDIVRPDGTIVRDGWMSVSGGRIIQIGETPLQGAETLDASGHLVLPGFVDAHVHTRSCVDEGLTATTCAAAAGGTTTIIDMPFDKPDRPVNSVERLESKVRDVNAEAVVDVALYATFSPTGDLGVLMELADAGAAGFKVSTIEVDPIRFPRIPDGRLYEAFQVIAETGRPVAAHQENQEIVFAQAEAFRAEETRPDQPRPEQTTSRRGRGSRPIARAGVLERGSPAHGPRHDPPDLRPHRLEPKPGRDPPRARRACSTCCSPWTRSRSWAGEPSAIRRCEARRPSMVCGRSSGPGAWISSPRITRRIPCTGKRRRTSSTPTQDYRGQRPWGRFCTAKGSQPAGSTWPASSNSSPPGPPRSSASAERASSYPTPTPISLSSTRTQSGRFRTTRPTTQSGGARTTGATFAAGSCPPGLAGAASFVMDR